MLFSVFKNSKTKKFYIGTINRIPDTKELQKIIELLEDIKRRGDNWIKGFNQELSEKAKKFRKMMKRINEEEKIGYIYLLKSNGLYKIGRAKNVKERIKGYRTQNPFGIQVVIKKKVKDYISKEKYLLKSFQDFREKGEWFKLRRREIKEIREYLNGK
jgi:DNA integrity scanning protein DisA with diadenylate cyclase activity